jgi:nuclear pore complex protein Nup133
VQIVLKSAFQYRAYNVRVYGIVPPMIKAWTGRPSIIDAVLSLFDLTTKAVEASGALGRARDREPGSQLPALSAVLLESMKERLLWLSR